MKNVKRCSDHLHRIDGIKTHFFRYFDKIMCENMDVYASGSTVQEAHKNWLQIYETRIIEGSL